MKSIVYLTLALMAFFALLGLIAFGSLRGSFGCALAGFGSAVAAIWLLGAEPRQ